MLQHISHVERYCYNCHGTTTHDIVYRSPSSYTAERVICQSCAADYLVNADTARFIREKNEQYDRWGSPPSPRSTYRY